jgi:hypothetical protein
VHAWLKKLVTTIPIFSGCNDHPKTVVLWPREHIPSFGVSFGLFGANMALPFRDFAALA